MSTLHAPTSDLSRREPSEWGGVLGRWMIFASGLALLVSGVILPAQADLRQTRVQRDRALHIEKSHAARIDRYEAFLAQIEHPDQPTIELLAMSQLGMIPSDRSALLVPGPPADPRILEFLEPAPAPFVEPAVSPSRLEALTTDERSRLWVMLIGAVAVMYGLLPPVTHS